jgi:hypothetical protein
MKHLACGAIVLAIGFSSLASAADTTPPSMTSLELLTPVDMNVISAPAAMAVRVGITDDSSGLSQAYVDWVSPSGQQAVYRYEYAETPLKTGTIDVQTPQLTLFAEPGTWTLTYISLCDRVGRCRDYSGSALDPFLSPRTVNVVNTRRPDVTKPTASAGVVMTPTISLASSTRRVRVRVRFDDDISGVRSSFVCVRSPSLAQAFCLTGDYSYASRGANQYVEGQFSSSAETGNWTIYQLNVNDVPGNQRVYDTAAQLDAIFTGGRTVTVTP